MYVRFTSKIRNARMGVDVCHGIVRGTAG
jgi:hypothetical protein